MTSKSCKVSFQHGSRPINTIIYRPIEGMALIGLEKVGR